MARKYSHIPDVNHIPSGRGWFAFRVVVFILLVELCRIRVGGFDDLCDAYDRRWINVAVVKEDLIADCHAAHEIASLVVAYSIPTGGLIRRAYQVID